MKAKSVLLLLCASISLAACSVAVSNMYEHYPDTYIIIDVGMVDDHLSGPGWSYSEAQRQFFIYQDGDYIVTGTTVCAELGTPTTNGNRVTVGPALQNVSITLLDAYIDLYLYPYYSSSTSGDFPALEIQNGSKVTLLLKGTNYLRDWIYNSSDSSTLMVPGNAGGRSGAKLVIDSAFASGSANGVLMIDSAHSGNPCIGGNDDHGTGAITIMGGTVIANGNSGGGAALGNSWSSVPAGTVSITGGLVIAAASSSDEAIGNSSGASGCAVTITPPAMVFATKIAATYTGAIDGTTGVAVKGDGLDTPGITVTVDGDGRQAGGIITLLADYYVPSGATLAVPAVVNPNLADPYRWTLDRNSNTIFGSYSGKVIN